MQETLVTFKVSIVSHPQMEVVNEHKIRIRDQALQLFIQYGARSVSMDDIAAAVGSSKKTIYQYYHDKDNLVEDAINAILINNCKECQSYVKMAENAIHEGFLAIGQTAQLFRNMNPVLMNDLKKYHPKVYKKFTDYKGEFIYQLITDNIKRGIEEGLYREDINVMVLARFRVESIIIPFLPDFYNKVPDRLFEVQEELFYFFLHGMATPKGQKLIERYKKQKKHSDANG